MASTFELKTDSQWIMVKTTFNQYKWFYSFKNKLGTLEINGVDKFHGAIPFEKGFGAVAIKNKHKTVNVVWHIIDEKGNILETTKSIKIAQDAVNFYRSRSNENQL